VATARPRGPRHAGRPGRPPRQEPTRRSPAYFPGRVVARDRHPQPAAEGRRPGRHPVRVPPLGRARGDPELPGQHDRRDLKSQGGLGGVLRAVKAEGTPSCRGRAPSCSADRLVPGTMPGNSHAPLLDCRLRAWACGASTIWSSGAAISSGVCPSCSVTCPAPASTACSGRVVILVRLPHGTAWMVIDSRVRVAVRPATSWSPARRVQKPGRHAAAW
jgi:hypothetical protein